MEFIRKTGTGDDWSGIPGEGLSGPIADLFLSFFQEAKVGFAIVDPQMRFVAVNEALAGMNGVPAAEHPGRALRDVLGEAAPKIEAVLRRVFEAGLSISNWEFAGRVPGRKDAGRWVDHIFPIRDETGKVRRVGAVVTEVTNAAAELGAESPHGLPFVQPGTTSADSALGARYTALIHLADLVVRHRKIGDLLPGLAHRLREAVPFEVLTLSLFRPDGSLMRLCTWRGSALEPNVQKLPAEQTVGAFVWQNQQPLILNNLDGGSRFPQALQWLKQRGVRSFCSLPLTTAERRLGALGFGSERPDNYEAGDIEFLSRIAQLVAIAVENAITQAAFRHERDRLDMVLEVNSALVSTLEIQDLFPAISDFVGKVVEHDFCSLALYDASDERLRFSTLNPKTQELLGDAVLPVADAACGRAFLHGSVELLSDDDLRSTGFPLLKRLREGGIRSICFVPLITRRGTVGTLNLGSKQDRAFTTQDLSFLKHVASQVAIALDNVEAHRKLADFGKRLEKEKLYLEDEIRSAHNFEEIVGESAPLEKVLSQIRTVAPSNATVLILGETGTGKELVARGIHRMSSRSQGSFIKLNCAAIPTGLLESELFGHEKGAFTGAVSQKIGRLELADKGTLFLDEVGEIPLELQPKLLRVLQDQEFERLGGVRTIKVDVRLVAATNRDLAKSVATHQFRSDLFYRLHVFPLHVPPLRERGRDVPLLVHYFVKKFASRMNKPIETIPMEAMNALIAWHWPGNVRELENFMERCVILTNGSALNVPMTELQRGGLSLMGTTLESLEREHILRVLRETGGVIAGAHGAAARLGLKRTTLQSRMQKMGITRQEYES